VLDEQNLPQTPPPRVGRLDSLQGVRRELVRIYKDMRQKKIPTQEGTRFAFVLQIIAKVLEQSDLEQRIEALEAERAVSYADTEE